MYIFGGFNSLLLSDILKYTPERCEAFANETACMHAGPGVRCVWDPARPGCVPWEMATLQQQQKVLEDCPAKPGMCHILPISLSSSAFSCGVACMCAPTPHRQHQGHCSVGAGPEFWPCESFLFIVRWGRRTWVCCVTLRQQDKWFKCFVSPSTLLSGLGHRKRALFLRSDSCVLHMITF